MLAIMVSYTIAGLWILALPLVCLLCFGELPKHGR